jgi:DNA polymerase III delta prime subunit
MNKDKDIRNFFKSSEKKEVSGNVSKIQATFEEIEPKKIELNTFKVEKKETKEEKQGEQEPTRKGRKRKGAEIEKDENHSGNEENLKAGKKKKTNNKKTEESKKMVEAPLPMEEVIPLVEEKVIPVIKPEVERNEKIEIKQHRQSKNKKIIDDDMDIDVPILNQKTTSDISAQVDVSMRPSNNISNNLNAYLTAKVNTPLNNNLNNQNQVKKNNEPKNLMKIDATSFFNDQTESIQQQNNNASNIISNNITVQPVVEQVEEKKLEVTYQQNYDNKSPNPFIESSVTVNKEEEIKILQTKPIESKKEDDAMEIDFDDLDLEALAGDICEQAQEEKQKEIKNKIMPINTITKEVESKTTKENMLPVPVQVQVNNPILQGRTINNSNINIPPPSSSNTKYEINFAPINKNTQESNHPTMKQSIIKTQVQPPTKPIINSASNTLWTARFAPSSVEDIIGNTIVVKKLLEWLQHWDDVVLRGNKREVDFSSNNSFQTRGKSKMENINARACIISGSPGIGKTTSVRLIANKLNFKTFELNASDQRNKQIIMSKVGYLMDNTTIGSNSLTEKNLIIMDEVDGMAGNEDKGGISALIEIIKKTKVPIICICNDIQNQKLRSLLNHCYELKFSKPDKRQVVKRLLDICNKEGMSITSEALENLCESTGNDIRQCLNFLDMRSRMHKNINTAEFKSNYHKYCKDGDLMLNPFDSCKRMLTKSDFRKLKHREKMDLFFIDFDLIPSLIHENYLSCYGNNRSVYDLRRMVASSENISLGDVIDRKIRTDSEWTLLPNRGMCSAVAPAVFSANFIPFTKFPELFGKVSKIRKVQRQLKEFKSIFPNHSLRTIKDEIAPIIFSKVLNYLIEHGKEGVEKVIDVISTFKMSIILFKENLFDLQTNDTMLKKYEKLHATIKSLLTRKLNEEFKTSIVKKKKKGN